MTYSIVARDAISGQMGVAALASGHGVGRAVASAMSGAGAVATQSDLSPGIGHEALSLLRAEENCAEFVLAELLPRHTNPRGWQIGVLDKDGSCATHTGDLCLPHAGHHLGGGYSVQANMMSTPASWHAIAESFEGATGDLASRMLSALRAGHEVGGDIRGDHSAVMMIVDAQADEWERVADFRVDWSATPFDDLTALISVERAYRDYLGAFGLLLAGDAAECAACLETIGDGKPEWTLLRAVALAAGGNVATARSLVLGLFDREPKWSDIASRFASTEVSITHPKISALLLEASKGFPR